MLADDLGKRIAERGKEIPVCVEDDPVKPEFDHRLRLAYRVALAEQGRIIHLLSRHVAGDLDDALRPALVVEDRVVGGLDPDLPAALANPLELPSLELTSGQAFPEIPVLEAIALLRVDEHCVVLAGDLAQRIPHRFQEYFVRCPDNAVQTKLDRGLRPLQCGQTSLSISGAGRKEAHGNFRT